MQAFEFHPAVAEWFQGQFGTPTEPQRAGWPAIQRGDDTLIAAPTGSGKTLAAFLASLDRLFRDGLGGDLADETRVLYISPLKALSNDIHKNLEEPLMGIRAALREGGGTDLDIRAEVRTGDTPAAKRQAIARKPPHILVTTPESFYLLLTSASGRRMLSTVRTLIVDEIHAVVGNRRGSHLAISMERLAALVKRPLQRIGLSATQKPIREVARFLVGWRNLDERGEARCTIVDCGFAKKLDLAIELPGSALEAVMSNEVWKEVYERLATLIEEHETTLVFVNTRRLAERVTHQLCERLGADKVASHHGSLSAALRLEAEHRLKRGELKALVATASLELGIDIGSVDLVCQISPTSSITTFLQRVGRAEHQRGGLPKGRLFPLSRDELVESVAILRSIARGDLDALEMPRKPLDVLAQQMVACAACEDWDEEALFELMRSAYPYHELVHAEFDDVLRMLADGFSTKRGRRAALIYHDAINHRVRARRGARLIALTSGGAIPDNGDYRVLLEPGETFIGTVNEDFAVESMAGDIFQLGNASWRILGINSGSVRVEDAHGQPPGIPFWLGEAPGRSAELSRAVSRLRLEVEKKIEKMRGSTDPISPISPISALIADWLKTTTGLADSGACQMADYFTATYRALGAIPSQETLVLERFFDESGGMQLVLHSPLGSRVNRAWGLALRKRFCRSFNFELQAAATDDAIVLSLGTQHSFPLDEVFHYLNSNTVRDLLIQALLDAPMFPIRWRWNATRSLALPRQRGGHKIPAPLQRMESENLLAAVFPDQLACLENIAGDRQVPDHPLVRQTVDDCLTEAMDIEGLENVLRRIETGAVRCVARDLPEPSPLAHEILNAKPYAFLDNAPLEERRTQAVYTRRAGESSREGDLGILDPAAIEKVCSEAWPRAANADELHEALLLTGAMTGDEVRRVAESPEWLESLLAERRVARLASPPGFWVAVERMAMLQAVYPGERESLRSESKWERSDGVRELVRGRIEVSGPVTVEALTGLFEVHASEIEAALLALEREGFILRGKFDPGAQEIEWCDRRLLARIHRLTINRLRAEIEPVSAADFQRFLTAWQRADPEHRGEGTGGVAAALELLDGYELPAAAWEPEVLALRVNDYTPEWLDQLCFTGRIGWGRLTLPKSRTAQASSSISTPILLPTPRSLSWSLPRSRGGVRTGKGASLRSMSSEKRSEAASAIGRPASPIRSSPVSLFTRENLPHWLILSPPLGPMDISPDAQCILEVLAGGGALFFGEIVRRAGMLPSRVEQALAELTAQGRVTADSFEGLRALLVPEEKRAPFRNAGHRRHRRAVTSVEYAGRWSLLRADGGEQGGLHGREEGVEVFARALLRRYGVVFRKLLEKESLSIPWFDLVRLYRRLEARGEIRGGYFVGGVSGEQFAFPEAIGLLRSTRKEAPKGKLIAISGADPLNLSGILSPGPRIAAITAHRILLRDGVPVAMLKAGEVTAFGAGDREMEDQVVEPNRLIEHALRVASMSPALRPYYG